jgi:hypothetical protein
VTAVVAAAAAAAGLTQAAEPAEALSTLDLSRRARLGAAPAALPGTGPAAAENWRTVIGAAPTYRPQQSAPSARAILPRPEPSPPMLAPVARPRAALPAVLAVESRWLELSLGWPGFVAGVIVAMAIGAGVYLSLVVS